MNMGMTRPAARAGHFYPADSGQLQTMVDGYLDAVQVSPEAAPPKALIVPHAGFKYSGQTAAMGYATLSVVSRRITRVVLLGPAHRLRVNGMAASSAAQFASPMGNVPVDTETVRQCVARFAWLNLTDEAHQEEHALETQLPFLQRALEGFAIVPVLIGSATPAQVAELLEFLWGGDETLILISSDLSHFKDHAEATVIDGFTTQAIKHLQVNALGYEHACGQKGVRGLLMLARRKKLWVKTLGLCNSGDVLGAKDRVVGYGCYGFYAQTDSLNLRQRNALNQIVNKSIEMGLQNNKPWVPSLQGWGGPFIKPGASFVTLNDKDGRLRGCIGTLTSQQPLLQNVAANAYKAAFNDGRFTALNEAQWPEVSCHISVLSAPQPLLAGSEGEYVTQLRPFVDGLIFHSQGKRGTFLPSVWASIEEPAEFLRQLKRKAGFTADYWHDDVRIERYQTESW